MPSLKNATALAAAVFLLLQISTLHAQSDSAISDLLVVLDADGRSHTVQHTIATNGVPIQLRLPGSVVPQEILFFGPDQQQLTEQNKNTPNLLQLTSGSAFARYQHQYGIEVQQIQADHFVLTTSSVPINLEPANLTLSHSSSTWVFPNEFELISYTVTEPDTGHWVVINNTLTFHQLGSEAVKLSINYKRKASAINTAEAVCHEDSAPTDACSEDSDEDGIPDYRDICASELGLQNNKLGCADDARMLLDAIDFQTGRTYLNVTARSLLDKVAQALIRNEEHFYEIGAHTDNAGAAKSNQQLSKKRADAVRHYLILRGVNPNRIRAEGYGEQYPIRDNASADGRRANRRIELVVID